MDLDFLEIFFTILTRKTKNRRPDLSNMAKNRPYACVIPPLSPNKDFLKRTRLQDISGSKPKKRSTLI
jgi:hypothetical protein